MAEFKFEIPAEITRQLQRIANLDDVAPKMIDEAGPILVASVKRRLAVHRHTGALEQSVKFRKAKKAKGGGYYGKAYFDGYDRAAATPSNPQGVANDIKAMALEWGSSKQAATPFLVSAKKDCEREVVDTMQEVFNREAIK